MSQNPPPLTLDETELRADLVRRARELQPLLRSNAARTDTESRVPDENIQAIEAAGLFRVMQPRRFGGFQASVRTHLEVTATIAEACPGTSWVVNLIGTCAWFAGLASSRAQDDIYRGNPNARVAGVFTPSSQTHRRRVDGGLVVSGKWYYASGCLHADWGMIGLTDQDEHGNVTESYLAFVPMDELTVEDTWHVVGMRGSGSNCLVANDVYVPFHRMFSMTKALAGEYATEYKDELLYQAAFVPQAAVILAGPQLGMGRAALRHVVECAGKRGIVYTAYGQQAKAVSFQMMVADAAMKIDTAHLLTYRAADEVQAYAESGRAPDYATRARIRCDTSYAIRHITEAIDILLSAHGSGSFAETNPMQRWWRDANAAARHAVALPHLAQEIYGKALLGVDERITPLV